MEGEGIFNFRKHPRPGMCPVIRCKCRSRAGGKAPLHRLCPRHYSWWDRVNRPLARYYVDMKAKAKARGIEFDLTLEEFRTIVTQQNYMDAKGNKKMCLHLDRIDPTQGYTAWNVQILTCSDNVAKGNRERHLQRKAEDTGY